jgi:hypothetical protein
MSGIQPVQSTAGSHSAASQLDAGSLASSILADARRGNTTDVAVVRAAVEAVKAQNTAFGLDVERALMAQLSPVQQGQYLSARYSIAGPDGQSIVFANDAPTVRQDFAAPSDSSRAALYARFDGIWGDGNPRTDDVTRIENGLRDLQASGLSLAEYEAQAATTRPEAGPSSLTLAADLTQMALDLGGIVDPTGIADGSNAMISVGRAIGAAWNGEWSAAGGHVVNGVISVAGILPLLGDAAKLGKIGKWAQTVSDAVRAIADNPAMRQALEPTLREIHDLVGRIPQGALDALPQSARESLEAMKRQLDEFFGVTGRGTDEAAAASNIVLTRPNISEQRARHILYGDGTGGGHLFPGGPGKSAFPQSWSAERILDEVDRIAADVSIPARTQANGRTVKEVMVDGINIRVVQESAPNGRGVVTAFPTNVPRNP